MTTRAVANTWRVGIVVALVSAGLLSLPGAAHAAASYRAFLSESVRVDDTGALWRFDFTAYRFGGSEPSVSLTVDLERVKDPDGVLRGTQRHSFRWEDLPGDTLTIANDLSGGSFDTGNHLGDWGQFNIAFDGNGALDPSCGGHNADRHATLSGQIIFKTMRPYFGTINQEPGGGTLFRTDGDCPFDPFGGCPDPSFQLFGGLYNDHGSTTFSTYERMGANSATRTFSWGQVSTATRPTIDHVINETVPQNKVTIAADLRSGAVLGVPALFTSGRMDFQAPEGAEELRQGPYDCSQERAFRTRSMFTELTGTLRGDMQGFQDWTSEGISFSTARRVTVTD